MVLIQKNWNRKFSQKKPAISSGLEVSNITTSMWWLVWCWAHERTTGREGGLYVINMDAKYIIIEHCQIWKMDNDYNNVKRSMAWNEIKHLCFLVLVVANSVNIKIGDHEFRWCFLNHLTPNHTHVHILNWGDVFFLNLSYGLIHQKWS